MKISFTHKGSFKNTENFLKKTRAAQLFSIFDNYGKQGVSALEQATPVRSGLTRDSWSYRITKTRSGYSLSWSNSNMAGRTPLVILIQYGHGTKNGAFVQGLDFINPALKPIFDRLSNKIWKEVTS